METTAGVTSAKAGLEGLAWNVVGQTYTPKLHSDNVFMWHAAVPADTFVPPHVHPTQDEWILVLDGELEVDFGFEIGNVTANKAGPGDVVRMPREVAHGVFNRRKALRRIGCREPDNPAAAHDSLCPDLYGACASTASM